MQKPGVVWRRGRRAVERVGNLVGWVGVSRLDRPLLLGGEWWVLVDHPEMLAARAMLLRYLATLPGGPWSYAQVQRWKPVATLPPFAVLVAGTTDLITREFLQPYGATGE